MLKRHTHAMLTFLCGLGWACDVSSVASHTLEGVVTDEALNVISGATVTLLPTGQMVKTGADGRYSVTLPQTLPPYLTLGYAAAGYAALSRTLLNVPASAQLPAIEMRPVQTMTILVPAAGQPAIAVDHALSDGGVSLRIEPGDLVNDANAAVTGNANLVMAYWHPKSALNSIPALLVAASGGNATVPLQTFGMLSIAAEQDGQALRVADGSSIEAVFDIPATQRAQIAASGIVPNLYFLDPNVGIWVGAAKASQPNNVAGRSGGPGIPARDSYGPFTKWPGYAVQPYSLSNVTVVYDPNTGKYTTTLPYFAAWNVDGELPESNGGCVQGKVVNACSPRTGFVNQPVTFWALGFEQLKDYRTVTDSQSNYCVNVGISPYQAAGNGDPEDTYNYSVNYFVSGASIDDTSACDPLPMDCRSCNASYEGLKAPFCNLCQLSYQGDSPFQDPALAQPRQYSDTCSPPTSRANLNACHFCPGTEPSACTMPNTFDASGQVYANGAVHSGCVQLDPIAIRPASCNCQYRGAVCTNSGCCAGADGIASTCNNLNVCTACTKWGVGAVCSQTDGCCDPEGVTQLACEDNVCVLNRDPTFTD